MEIVLKYFEHDSKPHLSKKEKEDRPNKKKYRSNLVNTVLELSATHSKPRLSNNFQPFFEGVD